MDKTLFDYCRYYKKNNTTTNAYIEMFIICEDVWCNFMKTNNDSLNEMLSEYLRVGLADFQQYDGTPITLKAVLYNRFRQYYEHSTIEDFKKFYIEQYVG